MGEVIKLTDADGYTRRGLLGTMLWGDGATNEASGEGMELCTNGVIHAYKTPLLAVFMDQIHADYLTYGGIAWLAEGRIVADDGLKVGCKKLTTVRRIDLPKVTTIQHVAFGILSVMEVCQEPKWRLWADNWLSGKDRSAKAAANAAWAARAARVAEAWAAWVAEEWAAGASAGAAAARAAWAAEEWAAMAAAGAAAEAAASGIKIDFAAIAEKAMQYE